ncbi:MAG: helix-turn-helix domain-containing protein [Clostridiales bacterium]|nr:helix-turn-helix domain-containing protein [Clostridiales bacterium]
MNILRIRHSWPEPKNFSLKRPSGASEYVLLHFHNAVKLTFLGECHETAPGAFIIFSPHEPHIIFSAEPLLHDWIHLTGDVAAEISAYGLFPDTLYQPACNSKITDIIAHLEAEFFAKRAFSKNLSDALFIQLWVLLARELSGDVSDPVPRQMADQLRALRADMLLHPEAEWSNEQMARRLGVSVSRLYPLYRRLFSISPGKDLILMRVEKAKNMLLQGESVSRTAEAMGYANIYHFIRQFKQITGSSPGKIRG